MSQTEKAGAMAKQPASNTLTNKIQRAALTRQDFLRDCIGRLLTLAVAAAGKNESLVNRLLRAKDRLNRRHTQ